MIPATIPVAIFDIIAKAVQNAAERPEIDIPADRKEVIAQQVVREAQKLPEVQDIEEASAPKPKWQSKGIVGAVISGAAAVVGSLGFVLAPQTVDAAIGVASNAIVLIGAVMAYYGRKNATRPVA